MSHNQTIDGVSRELVCMTIDLLQDLRRGTAIERRLRALLDAPACSACNDTGRVHEPGCEPGACTACLEKPAAQPQPVARVEIGADRNAALTVTDDDWLRSLKDSGVHQIVSLYAEQPAPVAVVPELTSELRWILGQMCFQHIHTAQALRLMGHEIARKAEDEQAVTIYWMLGHYLEDPANWRQNATAELKASAPAV